MQHKIFLIIALIMAAGTSRRTLADEPRLNLLRPDSLAGWDQGPPPRGWKIAVGRLAGTADSSLLVSAWTMRDFRLTFAWSVAAQGQLVVSLLDVPTGAGLEWTLKEGAHSGTLRDGTTQLSAGIVVEPRALHWAELARSNDRLELTIDSQRLPPVTIDRERRFGLGLRTVAGAAELRDLRWEEPAGEPIFNGRDFSGWWSPGGLVSWGVDGGALVCLHKDGNYLRSDRDYENFTLSLEYKAAVGCNSGIGIRTARNGWPSGDGMELQLLDAPGLEKDSTMGIYGNLEPFARADRSQQWNAVVLKADGRMISAWVNGQLVQQANTARLPELAHRRLSGWIGFQDHGRQISFRNIRLLSAPDGLGLDAWYAPRAPDSVAQLLDGLMNIERLSVPTNFTSFATNRSIAKRGDDTLVDLEGPGALVGFWRSADAGRVAIYLDGHARPLIECSGERLCEHLPLVGEDRRSPVTCLPFARHLKVVVRDAPGEYRLDYVKFPPDATVTSYDDTPYSLPRGYLPAIDYRQHQLGWGTHREADLDPRFSGAPTTIAPGDRVKLVTAEGAGIVQWLKLHGDVSVLGSDDLWLETYVDGETQPAIAAPARFWFPSLTSGANHPNLVLVHRGGFASMLAMPFAAGLTVVARNTGKQPLEGLAATVSVMRPKAEDGRGRASLGATRRGRLRGRFQAAADSSDLVSQQGAGRWIGFVYRAQEASSEGLAELAVDGRKVDGWSSPSLDSLFGCRSEESECFHLLSGHQGALSWRYLLLTPVEFRNSLQIKAAGGKVGDRLALFYLE